MDQYPIQIIGQLSLVLFIISGMLWLVSKDEWLLLQAIEDLAPYITFCVGYAFALLIQHYYSLPYP